MPRRYCHIVFVLAACGGDAAEPALDSADTVASDVASDASATEVLADATAPADVPDVADVTPEVVSDVAPEVVSDVAPEVVSDVAPEVVSDVVTDPCPPESGLVAPLPTELATLAPTELGKVRGVWLSPSDRPFPPGLHARLDAWMTMTAGFFGDELLRWTGVRKTLVPQRGDDGLWDVVFLQGAEPLSFYHAHAANPDAPGEALAEIFRRLPEAFHRDAIIVYFYDTAIVSGAGLAHTGQGGSAAPWQGDDAGYALIGSHVLGFGFDAIRVDPATQRCAFDDAAPSGLEDYDGDSVWRALDRGEWASTFVGASIHELGHAFGLEHVFDDADGDEVENNVMGNGFRRFGGRYTTRLPQPPTVLGPTSAEALADHPYLD